MSLLKEKGITLKGRFKVMVFDGEGDLVNVLEKDNLIVDMGLEALSRIIGEPTPSIVAANWIAIGTGTAAADVADTELGGAVSANSGLFEQLQAGAGSWQCVYTWGAGTPNVNVNLFESGVFFGSTDRGEAGTMLCRQTFGVVTKNTTDTLTVTWGFTVA